MEININKSSSTPLYRQIMNQLIYQINEGILYQNERLPSERELAEKLAVNRSTVVRAYDELNAQGFVEKRASSGTYVIGQTEEQKIDHFKDRIQFNNQNHEHRHYMMKMKEIIARESQDVLDGFTGELPYKMIPNINLPNVNWQTFLSEDVSRLGYVPLRKNIAKLVHTMYDHEPKLDELMLTAGGQQSLVLLIQALLKPGDTVVVEDPSFFNGISVLTAMSIKVIRIPVDQDGFNVNKFEEQIKKASIQLVLTNPNFQNPTGTSMSMPRRKKLIELCELYRIPIIEDDVFGQLSYDSPNRLPLLKELSPQLVIYIGSISKILGSRMQLGWIEAPVYVLDEVAKLRDEYETQLNIFPQVMASYALDDSEFLKKLTELQQLLKHKVAIFIGKLQEKIGEYFSYTLPKGGYYIWLTFKGRTLTAEDWWICIDKNIAVLPSFTVTHSAQSCRINVARIGHEEMDLFMMRLEEIAKHWSN
ncbi:aminotransferase-like domain-containing protein [Vagococcus sp. JNUCC 83]